MDEDAPTCMAKLRTPYSGSVPASKDTLSTCSRYIRALFNVPWSKPCQNDLILREVSTASLRATVTYCSTELVDIAVDNVEDLAFDLRYDLQKSGRDACPSNLVQHVFVHRAPSEIVFVYGGVYGNHKSNNTWELYNYKANEWITVSTNFTEQVVCGRQCGFIAHKIYVMRTDLNTTSPFYYCFDPVGTLWSPIEPMSQPRPLFQVVVVGSFVYCIGGTPDGRAILDTTEEYDTIQDTWRTVGRLNHPRLGAAAMTSRAGRIYVVGGVSPKQPLCSVVVYDPATRNEPFLSGEVYDPVTNQWTVIAPIKAGGSFPAL